MLIRHGEKPSDGIHGVAPDGTKSKQDLTTRGWQRAGALVHLFNPLDGIGLRPGLVTPRAVFASHVEAGARSRRPQHTVEPLAQVLGIEVDHRFGNESEEALVGKVLDVSGPAIVCWHHEGIPKLVKLFAPSVSCPCSWPSERFDLVWVLNRVEEAQVWSFAQLPQLLLSGDKPDIVT